MPVSAASINASQPRFGSVQEASAFSQALHAGNNAPETHDLPAPVANMAQGMHHVTQAANSHIGTRQPYGNSLLHV